MSVLTWLPHQALDAAVTSCTQEDETVDEIREARPERRMKKVKKGAKALGRRTAARRRLEAPARGDGKSSARGESRDPEEDRAQGAERAVKAGRRPQGEAQHGENGVRRREEAAFTEDTQVAGSVACAMMTPKPLVSVACAMMTPRLR